MSPRRTLSTRGVTVRAWVWFASGLALASGLGCAGEELIIAEQRVPASDAPVGDGPDGSIIIEPESECLTLLERRIQTGIPTVSEANPPQVVGSWRGLIQDPVYYFGYHRIAAEMPFGELLLRIDADGNGSLRFGDSPTRAPPQAGRDPFLCAGASIAGGCRNTEELIDGFDYTLSHLQVSQDEQGLSLQVRIYRSEPWESWCEMQSARLVPHPCNSPDAMPGDPACIGPPQCDEYFVGPDPAEVDLAACTVAGADAQCDWLAAILEAPCVCAADGCSSAGHALTFTLRLSGDSRALSGNVLEAPMQREHQPLLLQRL